MHLFWEEKARRFKLSAIFSEDKGTCSFSLTKRVQGTGFIFKEINFPSEHKDAPTYKCHEPSL